MSLGVYLELFERPESSFPSELEVSVYIVPTQSLTVNCSICRITAVSACYDSKPIQPILGRINSKCIFLPFQSIAALARHGEEYLIKINLVANLWP